MFEHDPGLARTASRLRGTLRAAPEDLRAAEVRLAETLLALPREQSVDTRIVASLTRERIRISRTHGSSTADLVDACLVLRLLEAGEERRRTRRSLPWVSFLERVADSAYALNPAVLHPRLAVRPGPQRVLVASMRSYFRTGDYWCERTGIPRRWLLDAGGRSGLRVAQYVATRMGGFRPVWQTHLPPLGGGRHLTEDVYVGSHLEIARALSANPRIRGIASSSWYYDPEVAGASPHLAYVSRLLAENGCLCFEIPIDEAMRESALLRSRARRSAWERGAYTPRDYARLWSRDAVLRWAERQPGWPLRLAVNE
jgi:hypothetical protein